MEKVSELKSDNDKMFDIENTSVWNLQTKELKRLHLIDSQ